MRIPRSILALIAATAMTACSGGETTSAPATKADTTASKPAVKTVTLDEVLAHPRRAKEAARDQFRHPKGTLEFFEIGPGKRFAELWPGWYTNATAPYLAANGGQYIAILYAEGVNERLDQRIATCLLYTSPSPRDQRGSRMPSSA